MKKEIKALCIKDLYVDSKRICKAGDYLKMEEEDCGWESRPFLPPRDEYDIIACPCNRVYARKFRMRNIWVEIDFFDGERAANHYNGINFNEYFTLANMELTAENVEKIYKECHCDKGSKNSITIEGIQNSDTYNKTSLEKHKDDIKNMLNQLPDNFKKSAGGGWSFLNMCMRKDDYQWTGLHRTMEKLMTMGIATKQVEYLLPSNMWGILPAGMPYIAIL